MRSHHENEENQGNEDRAGGHQVGSGEGEMLRQHAAGEDADAQTEVPGGEVGGSGSATLGIGTKINEQSVERGEGSAETQTAAQGNQKKSDGRVG